MGYKQRQNIKVALYIVQYKRQAPILI